MGQPIFRRPPLEAVPREGEPWGVRGDYRARITSLGFVAHRTAEELRAVLDRFPDRDRLATRIEALEHEARTLAGEIAMELHDAEGAP